MIDRILQWALTRAFKNRYMVTPDMVYMDASKPVTPADMAIMDTIARHRY